MNKKIISFWILIVLTFSICFGYSLVFAGNLGDIEFKLSDNLFLDSNNLNRNRVVIKSRDNLEGISISGDCNISGKLVQKNSTSYVFELFLLDNLCDKQKINVFFKKEDIFISTSFNLTSSKFLYSKYLDYSDEKLKMYLSNLSLGISKLSFYETYNSKSHIDKYNYLVKNRNLLELKYMYSFVSDIIEKRKQKYLIPIKGANISTISSKLPNASRPYRESYTNGVHEGWDFDTNFGETVISLDYGIVIRVVDNFDFIDLDKLKTTGNLTQEDKIKNLDILRGKQVWVKTMKGDVAFYSHLNEVYSNVKVGDLVFKGQALGTVGITGVPDKNYTDYHLHIEVRKNPYINTRKVPYSIDEYMKWNWYFKGESEKYILDNQYNIFGKNE